MFSHVPFSGKYGEALVVPWIRILSVHSDAHCPGSRCQHGTTCFEILLLRGPPGVSYIIAA
jgi:hypothetical protein